MYWILNERGEPVPESDFLKWAHWRQTADRQVALDHLEDVDGEVVISTVSVGMEVPHGRGKPALWETMVFGGPLSQMQDRCSGSREQAEAMHAAMIGRVCEEMGIAKPTPTPAT